jgi:uncharacterized protein (DUF2249 family)
MFDTIQKIDVRNIPPHKNHETIFDTCDELDEGEHFFTINNHGPKPLRHQLTPMHGKNGFSWNYLDEGPEVWKGHIDKKLNS